MIVICASSYPLPAFNASDANSFVGQNTLWVHVLQCKVYIVLYIAHGNVYTRGENLWKLHSLSTDIHSLSQPASQPYSLRGRRYALSTNMKHDNRIELFTNITVNIQKTLESIRSANCCCITKDVSFMPHHWISMEAYDAKINPRINAIASLWIETFLIYPNLWKPSHLHIFGV